MTHMDMINSLQIIIQSNLTIVIILSPQLACSMILILQKRKKSSRADAGSEVLREGALGLGGVRCYIEELLRQHCCRWIDIKPPAALQGHIHNHAENIIKRLQTLRSRGEWIIKSELFIKYNIQHIVCVWTHIIRRKLVLCFNKIGVRQKNIMIILQLLCPWGWFLFKYIFQAFCYMEFAL